MQIGTVLISRNLDEIENTSPGYWNHCAIYVGGPIIIESQMNEGVIKTYLDTYMARAYTWFALTPIDSAVGLLAAEKANTLLGLPYRKLSSLWRRVRNEERGMNCVDAGFRVPYEFALKKSFAFVHWPDDVVNTSGVFKMSQR